MNVDKKSLTKVVAYLRHLGLSTEETDAYVYLLQHGAHTVLTLSRGLKTGRTKLYPLLDDLAAKQLVIIHERHYGTSYEASDPAKLEHLVAQQEKQAATLRSDLLGTVDTLSTLRPNRPQIEQYSGLNGIKQLYWAMSQSTAEKLIVTSDAVRKKLGAAFLAKYPVEATSVKGAEFEIYIYDDCVSILTIDSGVFIRSELVARQYQTQYFA